MLKILLLGLAVLVPSSAPAPVCPHGLIDPARWTPAGATFQGGVWLNAYGQPYGWAATPTECYDTFPPS